MNRTVAAAAVVEGMYFLGSGSKSGAEVLEAADIEEFVGPKVAVTGVA